MEQLSGFISIPTATNNAFKKNYTEAINNEKISEYPHINISHVTINADVLC